MTLFHGVIMRFILPGVLAAVLSVSAAHVQPVAAQTGGGRGGPGMQYADSATATNVIYARLFAGIKLTPKQESKAKGLIWETESAQQAAAQQPDGFDTVRALQATRDSALALVVPAGPDRAKFEANAAKMRPVPVQPPPNA
ncbi:MAG TPA: hypothetical protein VGM67_18300 [Gemmatimonadaceae bacterium]|jgi:Spy/CpxP family protein refolding chaperone